MASSSVAPGAWFETFLGSVESWRFWRLAERRVEWDLESKWWWAMGRGPGRSRKGFINYRPGLKRKVR